MDTSKFEMAEYEIELLSQIGKGIQNICFLCDMYRKFRDSVERKLERRGCGSQ
jgi:hypothetical protein